MFTTQVYKVMIGSLSGTMEEVYAAKETIRKWNLDNAKRSGKLFLPVEWSMKVDPSSIDVVIGIVGNWVDNTCFIEECLKEGKQVKLFFNDFQDPRNTIQSEHNEVKAFRDNMDECCCVSYCGLIDFCRVLDGQLQSI